MKNLKQYFSIILFCLFGAQMIAQTAAPTPGSGPLQNPRPTNSEPDNGEGDKCKAFAISNVDLFIDVIDDAPFHTIPSTMPDFHIAVSINDDIIYVSDPVNTFAMTEYICSIEGTELELGNVDRFYHASISLNTDLINELIVQFVAEACLSNQETEIVYFEMTYALVAYSGNNIINYPTQLYPEYFDCLSGDFSFTYYEDYCCEYIEYNDDGGNEETTNENGENPPGDPKGGETEGRSIELTEKNVFQLAPNPFTNSVQVHSDIQTVRILDIQGKVILETKTSGNSINTSQFDTGIYIFQLFDGNTWVSEKLIKTE